MTASDGVEEPSQTLKDLHSLLMETSIATGKLVCGNCGHEYAVKEGIVSSMLDETVIEVCADGGAVGKLLAPIAYGLRSPAWSKQQIHEDELGLERWYAATPLL